MTYNVIIVGGGNAAFCAAQAARERGARVVMLEAAPLAQAGGNSYFTAGAIRTTYDGLDDLVPLIDPVEPAKLAATDVPPYTVADFRGDMQRVTEGKCDPALTDVLVGDAADTMRWLKAKGLHFRLMYDRQSFHVDGRWQFWGGMSLGVQGGGEGLIHQHRAAAEAAGIEIRYESPVVDLLREGGAIVGLVIDGPAGREEVRAPAVVLACGGFEADPAMRRRELGPGWEAARVRGTAYNTGTGLELALAAGAQRYGDWAGCHAIQWDARAPETGDWELTNLLSKQSYPIGIVVNVNGERFLDEGADFRNYTYAKYGAEILKQPGALAFQLFDAQTIPLLRQDEYTAPGVAMTQADTIEDLARTIDLDPDALAATVRAFNASIVPEPFNPAIKDRRRTEGITPPKSNWALALDQPPFQAYAITCGITFTFGGVRVDTDARVLNGHGRPIEGLYAAGEMVGGLFYHNYPGGSGLTSGAVFGRRAGWAAAEAVGILTP